MARRAWTLVAVVAILVVATAGAGGEAQGASVASSALMSKQSFDGNLCKAVSQSSLYQLKIPGSCRSSKVVHG